MTLDELAYWGTPLVPTTLTDDHGEPLGMIFPDGTQLHCAPQSRIGQTFRDPDTGETLVVVWDGAAPSATGRTKGRLLPDVLPSLPRRTMRPGC